LSVTEDAMVIAGGWLALQHPALFLALLGVFLVLAVALIVWMIRRARGLVRALAGARPGSSGR
jgi:hypothetical protein